MFERLRNILNRSLPDTEQQNNGTSVYPKADTLESIASAYEHLIHLEPNQSDPLVKTLAQRLRGIKPQDWIRAIARIRTPHLTRSQLQYLNDLAVDDAVELLGFATLSRSGHTREQALNLLERLGHPRALPYVLIRLGDWVPQVRDVAHAVLRAILTRMSGDNIIRYHHLIEHLQRIERVDLHPIREEIYLRLRRAAHRQVLENGLTSVDVSTRLYCLKVLEPDLPKRSDVVRLALEDSDPTIRNWIARKILNGDLRVTEARLRRLLRDKSSRVSSSIIRSLTPAQVTEFQSELQQLTMADALAIREAARFRLSRNGMSDFASLCRPRIVQMADDLNAGCVAALGETGNANDFELVQPYLTHARAVFRQAAVLSLARLDRERSVVLVVAHLADTNGHVRRAVVNVLGAAAPARWIRSVRALSTEKHERTRVSALSALARIGGWEIVPDLLAGIDSDSGLVRNTAWNLLDGWSRRYGAKGWIKPDQESLDAIAAIWPRVRSPKHRPATMPYGWAHLVYSIDKLLRAAN